MLDATTTAPVIALTDDCQPVFVLPGGVETTDRCAICEAPFYPAAGNMQKQRTCGKPDCRRTYANRNRRSKKPEKMPCAVCGAVFKPASVLVVTCTKADCKAVAKGIRWHRWASGPGKAAEKGMRSETVAANLAALLARCMNPAAFDRSASSTAPATPAVTENAKKARSAGLARWRERRKTERAAQPPTTTATTASVGASASPNVEIQAGSTRTATTATPPTDPWGLPVPAYGPHLPAVAAPIALSPARTLTLDHGNAIHAAITYALGRPHDGRAAEWSLSLVNLDTSPSCVVVCFRDRADMERLRARPWPMRIGNVEHQAVAGRPWAAQLKAPPAPPPGRYRVRLDTVTPVVIKRSVKTDDDRPHGRNVHHVRPVAWNLISTLHSTLAPRLGLKLLREEFAVEIVEVHAEPTRDVLRGSGNRIRMHAAGWEGHLVLDVNAPALWLLECAARGMGLGGRVAFGFGQVRITRLPAAPLVEPLPPPVDLSPSQVVRRDSPAPEVAVRTEVVEVFEAAASPPARRVGAAGAHPARSVESVSTPVEAPLPTEQPAITLHALGRYARRIRKLPKLPRLRSERQKLRDELAALVSLCRPKRARKRGPEKHRIVDPWEWVGPRIGTGHASSKLRIVVGRSTVPETAGNLVVATVLPLHDSPK